MSLLKTMPALKAMPTLKAMLMLKAMLLLMLVWASLLMTAQQAAARSRVLSDDIKTLQVTVNDDWLSPPVMKLGTNDVLNIDFDQLSHVFHRYVARLEHCEADWSPSDQLFESDWLEGFNDITIDNYENSLNTTVLYTHYSLQIPNDRCRLKMSGNYRLHILDDDDGLSEVACAEFCVTEQNMQVGLSVTTNTDIDHNRNHQQVSMTVNYVGAKITNLDEQIYTVVRQNGREDNQKLNPHPTFVTNNGLKWEHNRQLIFEAGNEYHKFEVLDVSHPTMGIDIIRWDGHHYQAYPFNCEPRRNYSYDEDANGAFYIRNSNNTENDYTCDYVFVNYCLAPARHYDDADIIVDGNWTTEEPGKYIMHYDEKDRSYRARILQKQGYYSYQFLMRDADGTTHTMPEEGSFFETENRYQAYVYYRPNGTRTWRLVGYQQIVIK